MAVNGVRVEWRGVPAGACMGSGPLDPSFSLSQHRTAAARQVIEEQAVRAVEVDPDADGPHPPDEHCHHHHTCTDAVGVRQEPVPTAVPPFPSALDGDGAPDRGVPPLDVAGLSPGAIGPQLPPAWRGAPDNEPLEGDDVVRVDDMRGPVLRPPEKQGENARAPLP